ncbi:MAG: class II fumarate hydratase [Luteolibacter sp.]
MEMIRMEKDSMGEMAVPAGALYGASTQRAVMNFPISGETLPAPLIRAYGMIKAAAAETNHLLGELDPSRASRIADAARAVAGGRHDDQFVVDIYQTGSGTSTNMNVNEVIARLANLAAPDAPAVHPNDHVNHGQSSNDTFPTAIHVAAAVEMENSLRPALRSLREALAAKAREFDGILKIGRTHLMDAVPMRLGQEFGGWARQVEKAEARGQAAIDALMELPLGGTAVGTGLNAHREFPAKCIARLAETCGLPFRRALNPFEAQAARDAAVEAHGQLNSIAVSLHKIASDIRLLASGPRCGFAEIQLPAIQPGSSIMPGKVNPVLVESVTMVAARVFGNQTTVTACGCGGFLELNVSMPLIAKCLLESITLLANASRAFAKNCVAGISADEARCRAFIEHSMAMVTALVPLIGYDRAAALAKRAMHERRTIRELCLERLGELGISQAALDEALDPRRMTEP